MRMRRAATRFWAARVTLAWAVLGAAVGVCPMYADAVYYGGSWADPHYAERTGTRDDSAGKVLLFRWAVYDGHGPDGYAYRAVDAWTFAIGAAFAAAGAAVAVGASRLLPPGLRRPGPTDPVLGIAAAGAVFAGLAAAGVPWENQYGHGPWWYAWQHLTPPASPGPSDVLPYTREGLFLLTLAAPVGWAAQAVTASCGVRLSGRPDPGPTADYDDSGAAEPAGAVASRQPDSSGGA